MTNVSDTKANTVHDRTKRSCLNCGKYFIPKGDLPAYVEGKTTQVWCNKVCYVALYPPVIEEIQCSYCSIMFVPKAKHALTCGSKECRKKRKSEYQRKRYQEDPEHRKKCTEYERKRYQEDPEHRKKCIESERKRREDPEYRKKKHEQRKLYLKNKK